MPDIKDIIRDACALPVEERAILIDSLLRTLNPPDGEIDRAWLNEGRRRLDELRSGTVAPVPGDEVVSRIKNRFAR